MSDVGQSINVVNLNIQRFDPQRIRPFSTILFAGGRRTGKSFAMRDIICELRDRFYEMVVFTGTDEDDHPWTDMTPPKYVNMCIETFPDDVLNQQLATQRTRKEICTKAGFGTHTPATLLTFEDLEFLKPAIWTNGSVRSVWFNGRHTCTYAFCAFQYIMEIKMALRGMFDYAFFMMDNNVKSRERIREQYCGVIPTMEMFDVIFKRCTSDFRAMVVDLRSKSYNIEDCVFWYKARDHGVVRIGVEDIWSKEVDLQNLQRARRHRKKSKTELNGENDENAGTSASAMAVATSRARGRGRSRSGSVIRVTLKEDDKGKKPDPRR